MSEDEGDKIIGLVWESKTRPKEAICITIELKKSVDTRETDGGLDIKCSCTLNSVGGKVMESKCWHVDQLLEDVIFCMRLNAMLENDLSTYFPRSIRLKNSGKMFFFNVGKQNSKMESSTIAKKWHISVTYDENLGVFVPVAKVFGKPVACCVCRSSSTRRGFCMHELSCRPSSSKEIMSCSEDAVADVERCDDEYEAETSRQEK